MRFWEFYGQMHAQFASTHEILAHPPVISSKPSTSSSYSPVNTNKINLIFRLWARPRRQDRKSGGTVACITNAVKHCFKSAWLGERRDLRQKVRLQTLSQSPVQINQVKVQFSLQNSSHGLAFTVTFPSIKYNTDTTWKIHVFCAFFIIIDAFQMEWDYLCSSCLATRFIKEPIKNLKPF